MLRSRFGAFDVGRILLVRNGGRTMGETKWRELGYEIEEDEHATD